MAQARPEQCAQAVELCGQDIQREIGPLSAEQRIALARALERLAADVQRIAMRDWEPWQ